MLKEGGQFALYNSFILSKSSLYKMRIAKYLIKILDKCSGCLLVLAKWEQVKQYYSHKSRSLLRKIFVNCIIGKFYEIYKILANLPISGLFDVMGMMDDTVFRKMVSDSKIVTPEIQPQFSIIFLEDDHQFFLKSKKKFFFNKEACGYFV